jgi:hypothetical protein
VVGTESLRHDFLTPSQKEEVEGKTAEEKQASNSGVLSGIKLSSESRKRLSGEKLSREQH